MISSSDIELFLPKYLSPENYKKLLQELDAFPNNIDKRMYTTSVESNVLYQGDGYNPFPYVELMRLEKGNKNVKGIILSNTCDISLENHRLYPSSILYAPIIEIEKYRDVLIEKGASKEQVEGHLQAVRKQEVSSVLYLPAISKLKESIVFFDRIMSVDNSFIKREELKHNRLFSLSDYGFYLLLFKLSVHFSRIQEKVNRGSCS